MDMVIAVLDRRKGMKEELREAKKEETLKQN